MANGIIPQPSQDSLRAAGEWLKVNGEAVYGAGPTPFGDELGEPSSKAARDVRGQPLMLARTEWRVTTKPGNYSSRFCGAARAIRAASDEEQTHACVSPSRRRARGHEDRREQDLPEHRAANLRPDGDGDRR
jgi:hypothetical protein